MPTLAPLRAALEETIGRPPRPPEFAEETAKVLLEVLGYEVRPPEVVDVSYAIHEAMRVAIPPVWPLLG